MGKTGRIYIFTDPERSDNSNRAYAFVPPTDYGHHDDYDDGGYGNEDDRYYEDGDYSCIQRRRIMRRRGETIAVYKPRMRAGRSR